MPRPPRIDWIRLLHHLFGRGIARRTVFETRRDVRYFLSLLAREVRAGNIELLAYCFLTTHYHLLVRSLRGELSAVMRRVLNRYVRYFNRSRNRDGALFRGRFGSRPVTSNRYLFTLLRYIDQNAPQARLSSHSSGYPHGSALHYCSTRRPRWLQTDVIDARMGRPSPEMRAEQYLATFGSPLLPAERRLVAARIKAPASQQDELDRLLDAAAPEVRRWMVRKADLADNTRPGQPYAEALTILRAAAQQRADIGSLCLPTPNGARRDVWPALEAGLLRDLGGLMLIEISEVTRRSMSSAVRRLREHRRRLRGDSLYSDVATSIAQEALRLQWNGDA